MGQCADALGSREHRGMSLSEIGEENADSAQALVAGGNAVFCLNMVEELAYEFGGEGSQVERMELDLLFVRREG